MSHLRGNRNSGQRCWPPISQRTFLQKTWNRVPKHLRPSGAHRRRPRQKRRQKKFQNFWFQIQTRRTIFGSSNRRGSFDGFYFPGFWASTWFGSRASVSGRQLGLGPGPTILRLFDHPDIWYSIFLFASFIFKFGFFSLLFSNLRPIFFQNFNLIKVWSFFCTIFEKIAIYSTINL